MGELHKNPIYGQVAAGLATAIAGMLAAVSCVTATQALFGRETVAVPLLLTLIVNNVATALLAIVTARVTGVAPLAGEAERKGVAAYVFANAAGTIVTLATHAMEAFETRKTPDSNALTILVELFVAPGSDYSAIYLWLVILLGVPALWFFYRGSKLFSGDAEFSDVELFALSSMSTLLLLLGIAVDVPWTQHSGAEPLLPGWESGYASCSALARWCSEQFTLCLLPPLWCSHLGRLRSRCEA